MSMTLEQVTEGSPLYARYIDIDALKTLEIEWNADEIIARYIFLINLNNKCIIDIPEYLFKIVHYPFLTAFSINPFNLFFFASIFIMFIIKGT